jgi:uncharacterized protein YjiS (DUF1127 family)
MVTRPPEAAGAAVERWRNAPLGKFRPRKDGYPHETRFIATLLAAWKRQRQTHETRRALQRLDPRTLRDIGIDASEILSVACEASGVTERQRRSRYVPYY